MGRRARAEAESGIHHVMNRGVDRMEIFFGDADRVEFGRRLSEIHERFGVRTLAYCLVPNHYHLVLRVPDGGLSEAMHHLGSVYTRHTNDRVGRDGPLFRGRFHSIPIETDEYLLWVLRYVHRNALDVAGVRSCADYRWSSYRAYLGHRRSPDFLDTEFLLDHFGGDRRRLAAFTDEPTSGEHADPRSLGSIIAFAIADDDIRYGGDEGSAQWLDRTVRLLLLDHAIPPAFRSAVEGALRVPDGAARRMAMSRARKRAAADVAVPRIVQTVLGMIGHRRVA